MANFELQPDGDRGLALVDSDGVRHAPVVPVREFPISDPEHWISICDGEGRELAVIEDLSALAPPVRELLDRELSRREFVPVIRRILSVPPDAEPTQWEVETDRGVTRFVLTTDDDVRRLGPQRALVIDSRGIRYLIPDIAQLDATSRRILERYF